MREELMDQEFTGALSGLRRLELGDLQTYKEALNQVNRICWQQYFPFLYFRYVLSRKDDMLISEDRRFGLYFFNEKDNQ